MLLKQLVTFICLMLNSLIVLSQNTTTTEKPVLENNYISLKNVMLKNSKTSVPTKVYFKNNKLPFFCDLEVKLEASAKMPVKFRLGEVQAVEKLEGKH